MSSNRRGKRPSKETVMKLWVAAGGRCQFEGCNKRLYCDDLTWEEFNGSNVAHITAASPDGPRGNEKSGVMSDKLENLMLLCPTHHKEIDSVIERFGEEYLKEMKKTQEQKVQELLEGMNYPETENVILESLVKASQKVSVDHKQTADAVRSIKKRPASICPTILSINSYGDYSSKEYWNMLVQRMSEDFEVQVERRFKSYPTLSAAVFPIAPIPLVVKLGELFGDKRCVDVFQKSRTPDTWIWQSEEMTNSFYVNKIINQEGECSEVAIIISLTAEITVERVLPICNFGIIYQISATKKDVDSIKSCKDLKAFWKSFQSVCNQIKNDDLLKQAAVFPAIPVSAAFEIGRRHMPGVHPTLQIYDDCNGFFHALDIGGNEYYE